MTLKNNLSGWLNVFKEKGYTSTHVVRKLKKKFKIYHTNNIIFNILFGKI